MTSRIWLIGFLFVGFSAWADCGSDDYVNDQYVQHLNHYYVDLKVSVAPGSDATLVYFELQQLEEYQLNKSTSKAVVLPIQLKHLSCNTGPCGGCSRGAC
jgi:hypothetical protein